MKYQAKVQLFLYNQEKYNSNMNRTNAPICGKCNKALQPKPQKLKDFESTNKNNAIELFKGIEELSMSYQETNYEALTTNDAMKNFLNPEMREG